MTQEHPITPPPELVSQWFLGARAMPVNQWVTDVATQAARWGGDQELEACCLWMERNFNDWDNRFSDELRAARRPKPPSLKEQALDALSLMLMFIPPGDQREQGETIRRALEQLND